MEITKIQVTNAIVFKVITQMDLIAVPVSLNAVNVPMELVVQRAMELIKTLLITAIAYKNL